MSILPLLRHVFNGKQRFCLSLYVDIYAFRPAFSSILACIQHQNALHLAPKCTAFSTKTRCVQHQNALCLAPKRTSISRKQHKIWCKLQFYARHIHLVCIYNLARFASKLTLARIDFLQPGRHLVDKKAVIMLKILLKRRQKSG